MLRHCSGEARARAKVFRERGEGEGEVFWKAGARAKIFSGSGARARAKLFWPAGEVKTACLLNFANVFLTALRCISCDGTLRS